MRILKQEKEVPPDNFMSFNEGALEMLYDKIEEDALEAVSDNKIPVNSIIIFDDCAFDKSTKFSTTLCRLMSQGRHINCSVLITAQKLTQLNTTIRSNCSGAILFSNSARELDAISDDFNYFHCLPFPDSCGGIPKSRSNDSVESLPARSGLVSICSNTFGDTPLTHLKL